MLIEIKKIEYSTQYVWSHLPFMIDYMQSGRMEMILKGMKGYCFLIAEVFMMKMHPHPISRLAQWYVAF